MNQSWDNMIASHVNVKWIGSGRLWQYLVGVEHFASERVVPQGAGGAGAAVVQHLAAVLRLLLVLSLQIRRSLRSTPDSVTSRWSASDRRSSSPTRNSRRSPRARDRGCPGCSSARSPAPPSPGSWHSSAMFPRRRQPASAGPDEPRPSPSLSDGQTVKTEICVQNQGRQKDLD